MGGKSQQRCCFWLHLLWNLNKSWLVTQVSADCSKPPSLREKLASLVQNIKGFVLGITHQNLFFFFFFISFSLQSIYTHRLNKARITLITENYTTTKNRRMHMHHMRIHSLHGVLGWWLYYICSRLHCLLWNWFGTCWDLQDGEKTLMSEMINKKMTSLWVKKNKHGWKQKTKNKKKKQGYVRDSGPIKRSLLSRLSIRNHLSQATSSTRWLMGLHRPWVPAHYLVQTELLFKHKGRNMKHCFLGCHLVKNILFILVLE